MRYIYMVKYIVSRLMLRKVSEQFIFIFLLLLVQEIIKNYQVGSLNKITISK